MDGHVKPEHGAITRLVEDVEQLDGQAIVTPKIVRLDCGCWMNQPAQGGHGYYLNLNDFSCGWLALSQLNSVPDGGRRFFESPALIGCALAVSRRLYDKLWGFDSLMRFWGAEDLDFGLKCWLLGHRILHDPEAVVGHRFRGSFDNFSVPAEHVIANQLRMARKSFTLATWRDWVDRCRLSHPGALAEHPEGLWALAWGIFDAERASVEQERSYLLGHRVRDEFWFAERFALTWPRLASESRAALRAALTQPLASPSPPPCTAQIFRDTVVSPDPDRNVLPGDVITLVVACDQEDLTDITWKLPSFTLADYQADDDQAVMTEVTEIHDTEVQFFFMKPGDGQTVSVTAVAGGRQVMASTALADVFNSYIMFKSGNGPSRWVSLAMCSWEANVCAKHNGVWAIITQSTGTTPMGDEYIPPVWTSNAKNTKYAPVSPCPDFC